MASQDLDQINLKGILTYSNAIRVKTGIITEI